MRLDGLSIAMIGTTCVLVSFILSWYKGGNDAHWTIKWFFVAVAVAVAIIVYIKVQTLR